MVIWQIWRHALGDSPSRGPVRQMKVRTAAGLVLVLLFVTAGLGARAADESEKDKIEYLIRSVEEMDGAVFIRNGSEYDGKTAAGHLRVKLKYAGNKVQTAGDFIRLCASRSYLSGQPYTIRLADGRVLPAEEYFLARLKGYQTER